MASGGAGWRIDRSLGLTLVRCGPLQRSGLAHAFSTRRADDRDDFDLGAAGPLPDDLLARRERLLSAAGAAGRQPVALRQVHGSLVVRATQGTREVRADGAVWLRGDAAGPVPAVQTADCVPLLLVARDGRGAAAVHAGWRGTAAGVARTALETLAGAGVGPGEILAALGPAIGVCCYEVGSEVIEAVGAASGGAEGLTRGPRIDLRAALRRQLEIAGVPTAAIHVSELCTCCRPDLFFSYRRDGRLAGRMMSLVGPATAGLA